MERKTSGRQLSSELPRWFTLTLLLAGTCLAPRAAGTTCTPERPPWEAAVGSAIVRPAQEQPLWAEVFPQGTSAGLAAQAQDGGFVFAGQTTAAGAGGSDLWLLQVDAAGTAVWQETLGTAEDDAGTLLACPGGGFVAQGWSETSAGYWLVRLDASGALQWQEQVDLLPGHGQISAAFPQEAGLLLIGTVINPLFLKTTPALVRLDDAGGILWQWQYKSAASPGAGGNTYLFAGATPMAKGGFALSGSRVDALTGDSDLLLMMVDADGGVVQQWAYQGAENEIPSSLLKAEDDGFLYVGITYPQLTRVGHGMEAAGLLLLRLDAAGDLLWQRKVTGGSGLVGTVVEDPSGGFLLSGTVASTGGASSDLWAIHLDDAGNVLWQKTYGGSGPEAGLVLPDPLGGYLLQGTSSPDDQSPSEFWIAKLDGEGAIVWQSLYGGTEGDAGSATRLSDGDLLLAGTATDASGTITRGWIARLDETGGPGTGCSWIHAAALPSLIGQLEITDPPVATFKPDLAETQAAYAVNWFGATLAGSSLLPEALCTLHRVLIATAGADPTSGIEPLTVQFTARASGGAGGYSYSWSFGDGAVSDQQDPVHVYAAAGDYGVTLTVTDSLAQTATDDHLLVHVAALAPLVVSASADVASGTAPLAVHFAGSATGGLAPYSYFWVFGDGGTSTGQNPTHTYPAAGSFSAVLTVTDSLAHSASAPAITVTAYAPLVVSASADITSGTAPLAVHFTGVATGGLAPWTYSWTFGDGGTSTDQDPSHEYATAGAFSAILTVTDSAAHTASAPPIPITVHSPLVASAAADTSSGTAPLTVHFAGSASGGLGPYTYAWTFGDGGTSAVQNPSHEYAAAGSYPVSLTVTDSASRNATDAHLTITVSAPIPPPVISLMKKASPPFKIVVTGSNLQDGVRLFINGTEWTNIQWKSTAKVKILGGASLKTAVPKGVATTFRFLNPDGGETTLTWSW